MEKFRASVELVRNYSREKLVGVRGEHLCEHCRQNRS